MEYILFSVYEKEESFDIVASESLLNPNKYLLIKRVGEKDYIYGLFPIEKVNDKAFVMKMIGRK